MWIKTNTGYINTNNITKLAYYQSHGTVAEYGNSYDKISDSNIVDDIIREIMLGREIMEVHF
jgi:hypothetical protein